MPLPDHLRIMMSSRKSDWETPPEIFNIVNQIFDFDLDVCATQANSKVPDNFISPEQDAFKVSWTLKTRGRLSTNKPATCWMNPPYGKPEMPCLEPWEKCKKKKCKERGFHISQRVPGIGDWVKRAYGQSFLWNSKVVCLLPARTDTDWFQTVWTYAQLLCFMRGRYRFVGAESMATFPNVIAVFSSAELDEEVFEGMTALGNVIDFREGSVFLYAGGR